MKCPNDKTEMKKGKLVGGQFWTESNSITVTGQKGWFAPSDMVRVSAYKCLKCGKVELTTEK